MSSIADDIIGKIVKDCKRKAAKEVKEELTRLQNEIKQFDKVLGGRDQEIESLEEKLFDEEEKVDWLEGFLGEFLTDTVSNFKHEVEEFTEQVAYYRKRYKGQKKSQRTRRKKVKRK